MSLPVIDVTPPSALQGQLNGKLTASILADTPGLSSGPRIRLLAATSTRAWRALAGTAQQDDLILKATSSADSYRTYAQQVYTFTSRYQLEPIAGRPFRLWDSDNSGTPEKWYQLPNTAVAAVPGRSNHGWGLAVDVADASGVRLNWMLAHAIQFGWSWETQSEPWHIRYVTGDTIPHAVLEFEEAQMGLEEWKDLGDDHTSSRLSQGPPGVAGQQRDTALAFAWVAADNANKAVSEVKTLCQQILSLLQSGSGAEGSVTLAAQTYKVTIDPEAPAP